MLRRPHTRRASRSVPTLRMPNRITHGQALVEMALILPLLLLIVTGIIQFGVLLSGQVALVNGVRDAARYGSVLQTGSNAAVGPNTTAVSSYLTSTSKGLPVRIPGYEASRLVSSSVSYCSYPNPNSAPTTYSVKLTVSATYNHALFVPIISQILDPLDGSTDGGFRLGSSEQFRVENPPLTTTDIAACP